jgi:hypothetical protein
VAAALSAGSASASAPPALVSSTIKAASLLAAGQAAVGGAISVKGAALTEGVMKAMFLTKLRAALVVVLFLGFVATGATVLTCRTAAGQDDKKPAAGKPVEPAAKQEKDKETFTAWGKEIGGLQAGIRLERIEVFNAAANRWEATQTPVGKIHQGSDIIFKVFVRNLGKQEVKLKYIEPSCWLYSVDGRNLKFDPFFSGSRNRFWTEKTLQPDEKWEVGQFKITTRQPMPFENFSGLRLLELGKFRVSCPTVLMQEKEDKLATGEVEIEIMSPKSEKSGGQE